MKRTLICKLTLGLCLASLLPACRSSHPVTSYMIRESVDEAEVVSRFAGLSGVDVLDIRNERRAGFLTVQMTVQNNRGGDLQLEYQDEWYDRNSFVVDEASGWEGTRLGRGETRTLLLTAGSQAAESVRVNLRERHTVH